MKLLLSCIAFILVLSVSAQKSDSTICLPVSVAKKVAQDLVSGDSAKAMLVLATDEIDALKSKVFKQKIVIETGARAEANLAWQLGNEKAIKDQYIGMYNRKCSDYTVLQTKYKWNKFKSKVKSAVGIPVVIGLTVLYILK